MRFNHVIYLLSIFFIGCQKPFPKHSETASGLFRPLVENRVSVVFIAGFDAGDNTYYANAKRFFERKGLIVIDTLFSLDEIAEWLNANADAGTEYDEIHIVSHGNPWLGMSLKTTKGGERITVATLRKAKSQKLIAMPCQGLTADTKVILHSCGLGENRVLMQELQALFASKVIPSVYASPFFSVFGGKFAPHYLARPHYVFHPTAESPGPLQLAKELERAYPETDIDWRTAMDNRREASWGEPYSYRFNIPVDWEFSYERETDIPNFEDKEALMDWISEAPQMVEALMQLKIPIEKYRWKSEVLGSTLLIKGKTTVLCVLVPILQDADANEYRLPAAEDPKLYQIL